MVSVVDKTRNPYKHIPDPGITKPINRKMGTLDVI
jgi:hypothetical protein